MKRNLRFWLLLAMMLSIHISLYAADDTSPKKNEIEKRNRKMPEEQNEREQNEQNLFTGEFCHSGIFFIVSRIERLLWFSPFMYAKTTCISAKAIIHYTL